MLQIRFALGRVQIGVDRVQVGAMVADEDRPTAVLGHLVMPPRATTLQEKGALSALPGAEAEIPSLALSAPAASATSVMTRGARGARGAIDGGRGLAVRTGERRAIRR